MTAALSMSSRGEALTRTFRAALAALEDFEKQAPAEAAQIWSALASHLKSGRPFVLLDAPPMPMFDPAVTVQVSRELADGSHVDLAREGDAARIYLRDASGHDAAVRLNPLEATRLKGDIDSVMGGGR